jgi:hypothetical protein
VRSTRHRLNQRRTSEVTTKGAKVAIPPAFSQPPMIHEVRLRQISEPVSNALWGAAAARCEFQGCNRMLSRSPVTQERVNIAERAHIWAFAEGGARGHAGIAQELLNSEQNLLLVCHGCHRKIDQRPDGGRYTAALLQKWKTEHEARIELVTGIAPNRKTHVLLYGSNIGEFSSPLRMDSATEALFPERYPAGARPIEIGARNSAWSDRDASFWQQEATSLLRQFEIQVERGRALGDIEHVSVFARAPQPLLIMLGTLLTDLQPVDVFQLRREPPGWCWSAEESDSLDVRIDEPSTTHGVVALVLAFSATITKERVHQVLGADLAIWTVTVEAPHNDLVQCRQHLREFRECMRRALDRVKARHGQHTLIHVFPAMPISFAVELGRVRMPKADAPWTVYDQVNERGGFVKAIEFGTHEGQIEKELGL